MNNKLRKDSLPYRIWKGRLAYLLLAPLIIGLLITSYYPPISGLYRSFFDWDVINEPVFVGLDNFVELFSDEVFINSIPTMFQIAIPRLLISIFVPLIIAELIFGVKSKKMQYAYRVMVLLPIVAPGLVYTLLWQKIYDPQFGLLTSLLQGMNIVPEGTVINWLGSKDLVIFSLIFKGFPWLGGTAVLIYMSGLMNISTEVIESSVLDGCSTLRRIWHIDLPLLIGQIKYFLVFGLIGCIQDYNDQLILTNGGPGYTTYVPSYYMYIKAFTAGRMGYTTYVPSYYMYIKAFTAGRMGYASAVGFVMFMDMNNGGCYAFIQLNDKDYQNIKLSLLPAGDGGLLIVFNDGQYIRVNNNGDVGQNSTTPVSFSQGERIDASNEINPHNHFGDIMKLFNDERPAYVKLVYHHGLRRGNPSKHNLDSATIKFTINSINGVQACKPAEVITVDDGIYEIFPDTKFEQGFRVSGMSSLQEATQQPYWFKYGNDELIPTWKIGQWDSGEDLRDESLTMFMDLGDGKYVYENASKTITVDTQEGSLGLKLLSSQVYDDARKPGESWPHIMLENSYFLAASENPGALYVNNMDHLRLQISQQLSFFEDHMGEEADPSLHAGSFYMYIYIKGLNDSGRVEQLWFGLPMFDNRYNYCPEYGAKDTGKEDATGLFIYNVPGKDITTITWHDEETGLPVGSTDNEWMNVDIDLIPYIERALTLAQNQGYMKGVKMESVYVDGMNLGWEMPGTYDGEMIIKNLSLKSYVNTDYETASGTYSFFVDSMENVETVAVDDALTFEFAKDMIEMDGFDTSVLMLRSLKKTDGLDALKPETGKLVELYENGLTVNGENYEFTLDKDMTVTYTPSAELLAAAGSADNLKFYTVSKKGVMTALEGDYANGTFTFTLGKMASIAVVNVKPEPVDPGTGEDDKDDDKDNDADTDKDEDKTDDDAPATGEAFPTKALALAILSGVALCVVSKKKRAA